MKKCCTYFLILKCKADRLKILILNVLRGNHKIPNKNKRKKIKTLPSQTIGRYRCFTKTGQITILGRSWIVRYMCSSRFCAPPGLVIRGAGIWVVNAHFRSLCSTIDYQAQKTKKNQCKYNKTIYTNDK